MRNTPESKIGAAAALLACAATGCFNDGVDGVLPQEVLHNTLQVHVLLDRIGAEALNIMEEGWDCERREVHNRVFMTEIRQCLEMKVLELFTRHDGDGSFIVLRAPDNIMRLSKRQKHEFRDEDIFVSISQDVGQKEQSFDFVFEPGSQNYCGHSHNEDWEDGLKPFPYGRCFEIHRRAQEILAAVRVRANRGGRTGK